MESMLSQYGAHTETRIEAASYYNVMPVRVTEGTKRNKMNFYINQDDCTSRFEVEFWVENVIQPGPFKLFLVCSAQMCLFCKNTVFESFYIHIQIFK